MSDIANESRDDDHITVSKIYETLKSGPYLKKLYWDVLSDLKEKDTFKKMRENTEKLLNKKSEDLSNLSDSETDNLLRKTIVAEICSMSYAIDAVFSKILFIKLQKEFKTQIIEAIKDLRQERKIPDSVWSKLEISDDPEIKGSPGSSAVKNNSIVQKPETSCRPVRKKRQKVSPVELATKNREIRSEIHEDLKAINCDEGKMGVSRKNTNATNQAVQNKSSLCAENASKKKQVEENQIPSKFNQVTKTTEEEVVSKEDMNFDNPVSDAESEVSVGDVSLTSVSSVHTSDLSSFDDEISLSSEDGDNNTKRIFSFKELKEMSNNGLFSSKFNGLLLKSFGKKGSTKKRVSAHKEKQPMSTPDKANGAPESVDSSTEANSPSQKTLPKRIRKPNSKYSSENILCTIKKRKERKKTSVDGRNDHKSTSNENNSKESKTPCTIKSSNNPTQLSRKRSRSDTSDSDAENPSKSMKAVQAKQENGSESNLSLRSQRNSSDMYKPHFSVPSLTSRKTAPVTLYST